jgi:hypothetical protein
MDFLMQSLFYAENPNIGNSVPAAIEREGETAGGGVDGGDKKATLGDGMTRIICL